MVIIYPLYLKPKVFKLWPWSGGLVQNPSSLRRQATIASIAFSTATSMPFSLTKNVFPYFPDRRVQKTLGRANLTPCGLEVMERKKVEKPRTINSFPLSVVASRHYTGKLTSPTLKLRIFPRPPNWSTTNTMYLSSFWSSFPKDQ